MGIGGPDPSMILDDSPEVGQLVQAQEFGHGGHDDNAQRCSDNDEMNFISQCSVGTKTPNTSTLIFETFYIIIKTPILSLGIRMYQNKTIKAARCQLFS